MYFKTIRVKPEQSCLGSYKLFSMSGLQGIEFFISYKIIFHFL